MALPLVHRTRTPRAASGSPSRRRSDADDGAALFLSHTPTEIQATNAMTRDGASEMGGGCRYWSRRTALTPESDPLGGEPFGGFRVL